MDEEIKILREALEAPLSWERAGALFISGSIGNHEVIVVRSGIGKVAASLTTSLLIQQYGVNMVINTGSAGGIGVGLAVGDLVISEKTSLFRCRCYWIWVYIWATPRECLCISRPVVT